MDVSLAQHASLDDLLNSELEWIDDLLAKTEREIAHRPLEAGILFVKHFVQAVREGGNEEAVNGEQPDQWLTKPWFKKLMQTIDAWYRQKYGPAMKGRETPRFRSITVIYQTPFELVIPKTMTRPDKPGESVWLVFPVDIQPEEQVLEYIIDPPNLETMSLREKHRTEYAIGRIARTVRQIHHNLQSAERTYLEIDALLIAVQVHLDKAVNDLLDHQQRAVGSALYEMYMAVEKALKVVRIQVRGIAEHTHDLEKLLLDAKEVRPSLIAAIPTDMPSEKDANKFRYGKNPHKSVLDCVRLYYRILAFLVPVTDTLERRIRFENAQFKIGRLPWASSVRS